METAERRVSGLRVWIDDIEIPKCQHALHALHLGIFKNVGALVSLQLFAQQNTSRKDEDFRADVLSLSPKMLLLEVDDMLMQDHKTVFVQKSTSQVS
eukprot:symbB.v1.2.035072.t1/scaffold4649.1/size63007/1